MNFLQKVQRSKSCENCKEHSTKSNRTGRTLHWCEFWYMEFEENAQAYVCKNHSFKK